MLQAESSFRENRAFREGSTVEIEREGPELVGALLQSLETFELVIPPESSIEDLEYLLLVSSQYAVEHATYPLLEKELIQRTTPETAFYLYFLASEHHMPNLCNHCLKEMEENLDQETAINILETLCTENTEEEKNSNEALINCCLNFCISQLPALIQNFKSTGYDYRLQDQGANLPIEFQNPALFLASLQKHLPHLERLETHPLSALQDQDLKWVLEQLPPSITSLNLSGCAFKSLVNLERFKNLKRLVLADCPYLIRLDTLKPLNQCLEHLDINNSKALKNISPVANLANLKSFNFSGCTALSPTAISAIERFPNLQFMKIRYSESPFIDKLMQRISEERGWDLVVKNKSY